MSGFLKGLALLASSMPLMVAAQGPAASGTAKKDTPSTKESEHRATDIARHRQMASAHENAARCLEAGTPEKQCHQQLRDACKGIAVGQYCGMRHTH